MPLGGVGKYQISGDEPRCVILIGPSPLAACPGGVNLVPEGRLAYKPAEHPQDRSVGSAAERATRLREDRIERELTRIGVELGAAIHEERRRRHLSLREVAGLADVALGTAQNAEAGRICSLETYARLADALRLRADFELLDPRRREPLTTRPVDPVHAAMGEVEAAHLRRLGLNVDLDEPYQHFQFSGRADVVAWSAERRELLHIENKTRFPDLQDAFGSFNAKRSYLGAELADRAGIGRWRSETHVIAALWSAEVMHTIRMHQASFGCVCPDPAEAFDAWWREEPPPAGRQSTLMLLDPAEGRRRDRRQWLAMGELPGARPRYRDYAEAVELLGPARG